MAVILGKSTHRRQHVDRVRQVVNALKGCDDIEGSVEIQCGCIDGVKTDPILDGQFPGVGSGRRY